MKIYKTFDKFLESNGPTRKSKRYRGKQKEEEIPTGTPEEIHLFNLKKFCLRNNIVNYKINEQGSIDVNDHVDIDNVKTIKDNKIPFKFGRIDGDFNCSSLGLTTLENCPKYIKNTFECGYNNLTTLLGGPEYVGSDYVLEGNKLIDLYGFPKFYKGELSFGGNPIAQIINLVPFMKYDDNFDDTEFINDSDRIIHNKLIGKFIDLINEYQVIRGNKIVYSRLYEALLDLNIKFKGYEAY